MARYLKYFLFLLIISSCSSNAKPMPEWIPTECAPDYFPVEVIFGKFTYGEGGIANLPDDRLANNGWGKPGSIHLIEPMEKEYPTHLSISWFSYREDAFYVGDFDLDKKHLQQIFNEGYQNPITGTQGKYDLLITGMGPDGDVYLWCHGEVVTKLAATFKAKKIEKNWKEFVPNTPLSRPAYIRAQMQDALDLKKLENEPQNPLIQREKWEALIQSSYAYRLIVISPNPPQRCLGSFYNGETISAAPEKLLQSDTGNSMPQDLTFYWAPGESAKAQKGVTMSFDLPEILKAFAFFQTENAETPTLQVEIGVAETKVYLRDSKRIYELTACTIRNFSLFK